MEKKLTPMMQQYIDIKKEYTDCILFFRLGDFYEMFFEDALIASKALEITLTGKNCGLKEKAPMCGIPHHAAEGYINKLINKGFKVAIGEQLEDPKLIKGIVKRGVVRVVTSGTNMNSQSLEIDRHNYLLVLYQNVTNIGIGYVDITTGDFYSTQVSGENDILNELAKIQPKEILCNETISENKSLLKEIDIRFKQQVEVQASYYFDKDRCEENIMKQLKVVTISGLGLLEHPEALIASGALIQYLEETQKGYLKHLSNIKYYSTEDYMLLDLATRRNLELVETMRNKERKGSLLWVLDKTKTAMGARLLRQYVEQPLIHVSRIDKRLDGVEELLNNPVDREELREYLIPVYDIERLMSKISCQTANARDLLAFKQSIQMIGPVKSLISQLVSPIYNEIVLALDDLQDLHHIIEHTLKEEVPITIKEGRLIKEGIDNNVDKLRSATKDGKQWLAELEVTEREKTGIKNLKVKYNKIFGYYLEVTNSQLHLVPDTYTRKQTMSNGERYITPELKEMENIIIGAHDKLVTLEYDLFMKLRNMLGKEVSRIKKSADQIALVDVLQSLSEVAFREDFSRPKVTTDGEIKITGGRHPVVEKMMNNDSFISNDTYLNNEKHRFSIITGPNMAGKSTYMRQVALMTLMAQIGSFVPAEKAEFSICDRIFTRVGASDDLASGQSTFMVEMTEVANILRNATSRSLIILDEIGRGTSTFDGLSIAWAVIEYIVNEKSIGAKTLFATHYHELTELEGKIEGVQNYCISVKEDNDHIIFLRKIVPGGANNSYGIQVAKLAGVPELVIARAKIILKELDKADITKHTKNIKVMQEVETQIDSVQLNLFEKVKEDKIITRLKELDVDIVTPIEALNVLYEIKKILK